MSALKSTEVFFVHSHQKRKSILGFVVVSYAITVLLYCFLQTWGFRVVAVPVDIAQRIMPQYMAKLGVERARGKKQRAVVFVSLYGLRFGSRSLVLPFNQKPTRGDVVLVAMTSQRGLAKNKNIGMSLFHGAQNIASVLTFALVKPATEYGIMRVVGTEYERVSYSGAAIYEGDSPRVIVSDDAMLPYINTDNALRVPQGHVFLSSKVAYGLDSRYRGAYRVSDIVGKVGFLMGPVWGSLASK